MPEETGGVWSRLTIFLGESDRWHHHSLSSEIVRRAHASGLAGASVFHGIEGYGSSNRVHTARLLSESEDLPVVIVIIDTDRRVREFLIELNKLLSGVLACVDMIEIVAHRGRSGGAGGR